MFVITTSFAVRQWLNVPQLMYSTYSNIIYIIRASHRMMPLRCATNEAPPPPPSAEHMCLGYVRMAQELNLQKPAVQSLSNRVASFCGFIRKQFVRWKMWDYRCGRGCSFEIFITRSQDFVIQKTTVQNKLGNVSTASQFWALPRPLIFLEIFENSYRNACIGKPLLLWHIIRDLHC